MAGCELHPDYVVKVRTAQKTSISERRRQMSIGSIMAGHRKMCGRSVDGECVKVQYCALRAAIRASEPY